MVTPGHRLGHLQMGEPRHDPIRTQLGLFQQRLHQRLQRTIDRIGLITHPEPEIRGHLIIARPAGVKPPGRFANDLLQTRLDIHVNVFERG